MKTLLAVSITRQLPGAMGYAHRSGIVHRDLNPANIMIDMESNKIILQHLNKPYLYLLLLYSRPEQV